MNGFSISSDIHLIYVTTKDEQKALQTFDENSKSVRFKMADLLVTEIVEEANKRTKSSFPTLMCKRAPEEGEGIEFQCCAISTRLEKELQPTNGLYQKLQNPRERSVSAQLKRTLA